MHFYFKVSILVLSTLFGISCMDLYGSSVGGQEHENVALNKTVEASSETESYPASNVVNGQISRNYKWMTPENAQHPHILAINLKNYYTLSEIKVYTGIPQEERTIKESVQAAGFWSVKHFKLQYWDDANWTDIPNTEITENRETAVVFDLDQSVSTFKFRIVAYDAEPIRVLEIEAIGEKLPGMVVPDDEVMAFDQVMNSDVSSHTRITVNNHVIGESMKYVGYNQGYYLPNSNVSDWIRYSNINNLRIWTSLNTFVPKETVQLDENVQSFEVFEKRKNKLRSNPENNTFIKWDKLVPILESPNMGSTNAMVLPYVLDELKKLEIEPLLQINSRDFDSTWSNKWKQWQRFYALAYYSAKIGNARMFAMQNEPNHRHSGPMQIDQWIEGMKVISNAIRSAIIDVNKRYNKDLVPKFVGPVTAGTNTEWWASVAKNIRMDYRGNILDFDQIDLFSTHSYNSPAAGYKNRVSMIEKIIKENHPKGKSIPVVFTEIGRWMNAYLIDKKETMDSPSLFTEWAGIYTANMLNGGAGMWAFKLVNNTSSAYPRGIKSGHHYTWQGRKLLEETFDNIAKNKPVQASSNNDLAKFVTDGDKSDKSAWRSDSTSLGKWLEIDLGDPISLGSALIYTGSSYGVFTGPDRIQNFKLQYWQNGMWNDIPGAEEQNYRYVQVLLEFDVEVTTSKVRFVVSDKGSVKVREIMLFPSGQVPNEGTNYNITGIQRAGEVVRLFAKGFKDSRDLFETIVSVDNNNIEAVTSYDSISENYYIWLVQRGRSAYDLDFDLSKLSVASGTPVIAESVGPAKHGSVAELLLVKKDGTFSINLPAQSVMLLTIPSSIKTNKKELSASGNAMVSGGTNRNRDYGALNEMKISLDAEYPENNKVSYTHFNLLGKNINKTGKILLRVKGFHQFGEDPYRFHVYGMPSYGLDENSVTWSTAPLLHEKEALILNGGKSAFFAGQMTFDQKKRYHWLDVTELIKNYGNLPNEITFSFIRETRHLGDTADSGREAVIYSKESNYAPVLELWYFEKN